MGTLQLLPLGPPVYVYLPPLQGMLLSAINRRKQGPGVLIGGRSVDVDLALSQGAARSLAFERAGLQNLSRDNRSLYLVSLAA